MSINVPGVGPVQIVWMPASDEDFKDKSEGGRSGYQPIAFVYHRAVANTVHGIDVTFAAGDSDPATVGSPGRPVSANFGIGDSGTGGIPRISQYVDLSDTAYCNGDCQQTPIPPSTTPGKPSRWDGWYGHRGHNERTVSIEHDDNGGSPDPNVKGIVTEAIIKTSIELTRLLLSKDIATIRASGIRIRDQATLDALHKIVPGPTTMLMHNDIAGAKKPYCWRPWQADKIGFPRDRYIKELTAAPVTPPPPTQEDDMPPLIAPDVLGYSASIKGGHYVRTAPKLSAAHRTTAAGGETWPQVIGWVQGDVDPDGGTGKWLMRSIPGGYEFTSEVNLTGEPTAPVPDCTVAVKAATDPLNARIAGMKSKTAAYAADIADD